eukprot:scaffold16564_cov136-Isochrysis_galbana.AAC.5
MGGGRWAAIFSAGPGLGGCSAARRRTEFGFCRELPPTSTDGISGVKYFRHLGVRTAPRQRASSRRAAARWPVVGSSYLGCSCVAVSAACMYDIAIQRRVCGVLLAARCELRY